MTTAAVNLCLTDRELEELSGSPLPAFQMKWLDEQRWPYVINRRGRPRVARAMAEQRLGVRAANDDESAPLTGPDWPVDQRG